MKKKNTARETVSVGEEQGENAGEEGGRDREQGREGEEESTPLGPRVVVPRWDAASGAEGVNIPLLLPCYPAALFGRKEADGFPWEAARGLLHPAKPAVLCADPGADSGQAEPGRPARGERVPNRELALDSLVSAPHRPAFTRPHVLSGVLQSSCLAATFKKCETVPLGECAVRPPLQRVCLL